jgi:hypothetical protein
MVTISTLTEKPPRKIMVSAGGRPPEVIQGTHWKLGDNLEVWLGAEKVAEFQGARWAFVKFA